MVVDLWVLVAGSGMVLGVVKGVLVSNGNAGRKFDMQGIESLLIP